MTIRSAPLLAALISLAVPAFAQDSVEEAPPLDEAAPAVDDSEAVVADSASQAPALPPLPALQPIVVASPFSPDQRNGWLAQCRSTFRQAGAPLGGGNGLLDACETQLLDFERSYVPPAEGQPSSPPVILVRVPIARQPVVPAVEE